MKLGIRPEAVRVRGVSQQDTNRLEMRVDEMEFLGSFCRVALVDEKTNISVIADFSANVVRDLNVYQGALLPVQLPMDSLRVFTNPVPGPI